MKAFTALAALALASFGTLAMATSANATTVATIDGCYDCLGQFDTPTLVFHNNTGGTFTNAKMVLHGYQGLNNGQVATVSLGTIGQGNTQYNWGGLPSVSGATNLAVYDYDDQYGGTPSAINDPTCGGGGCVAGGGVYWYAHTGNFDITFTATVSGGTYDGKVIYSVFSPTTNATGNFVGWEGLDQNGFSESGYDIHSGVVTGDLANIDLGVPPAPGVPEPGAWAMMLLGFFGAGAAIRRRHWALSA